MDACRVHLRFGHVPRASRRILVLAALQAILILRGPSAVAQDITTGLIGHWKLTETSGTTATDSSSGGHNGTYNNGVSLAASAAAPFTGALAAKFDGFNDYASISSESSYDLTGAMTVAAWIRVDVFDVDFQGIVCKGNSAWRLARDGTTNTVQFACTGLSTIKIVNTSNINDGQWHHIVGVFTGSQLRIYVDGSLEASVSVTGSISTNNYAVNIGRNEEVSGREYDGAIYDVRVYNRALSATDIGYLYCQGFPTLHLRLDASSGSTAADSSGFGNNGALTGTASWTAAVRKNGHTFNYTNGNDYVTLPNADELQDIQEGSFTVAAWFKPLSTPPGSGSDYNANYGIIGKQGWHTALSFTGSNNFAFEHFLTGDVATECVTTSGSYSPGKFYHVAATVNRTTGSVRLYVDGQLQDSASFTANTASREYGTVPWVVGMINPSGGSWSWPSHGVIDDVRVYSYALSQSQVAELYGFVGHWKLSETSGATATDSSPMANNGTYTNGVALNAAGPYPGTGAVAANFDGSNDYVTMSNESRYDITETITVAAWIKVDAFSVQWPTVVCKGDFSWRLSRGQSPNSNAMHFACTGLTQSTLYGTINVNDGHWHHVVGVYDGTTISLYVDGVLDVSASSTGTISTNDQPVRIGDNAQYTDRRWDGRIHDVRVYNRALSASEIAELYGLVAHWKLDTGAGSTLADSSGGGNTAAFNAGSPSWISGVLGKALQFSGLNDAMTTNSFSPPTVGAVAFWMQPNGTPSTTERQLGLGTDWEVRQGTDGVIYFDLCGDGTTGGFQSVSSPVTSGNWYHVVAMYDVADESYAVYINASSDKTGTSTVNLTSQSAAQLSLGTRTGSSERFSGALDDIRVYNRKLSPWEIYQIYGLMAWYKLDETSGTVAADSTGRGQDGAYVGSPALNVTANGATSQGTAVAFNGSNYVQASGLFDVSSSVSASAGVRLDGADSSGAEVISLGDCFVLRLNSGATGAQARYYNGSTWVTASASQIVLNSGWHHFTAVLEAGSTFTLYVDGVALATVAASGGISYSGQGANTRIAAHGNSDSTYDLTGRIDDVRVFNRALKAAEVYQIYRGSRINGVKILKWLETR